MNDDFINKYFGQANSKLIAVDFDDTITKHVPYPEIAPLDDEAKKYLDKLHENGYRIVLWTARFGDAYYDALRRCRQEFDMPYIEEDSDLIHGESGKLIAAYYIDDKSSFGKVDWIKTYNYIINNI